MRRNPAADKYAGRYADLEFERRNLFVLLRRRFGDRRVLYPASAMHVTPSFYFRDVVYVDDSEESARFFHNRAEVLELIESNRVYHGSVSVEFLHVDFTTGLPVRRGSFGLLLSLYGGELVSSLVPYLAPDAVVLTRKASRDTAALRRRGWQPRFEIQARNDRYRLLEPGATAPRSHRRKRTGLVRNRGTMVFRDNDCYCLFGVP